MDSCTKCHVFIQDWFTQPLSPTELIFEMVHPKRLLRILPVIAPIFIRLIKTLTYYDITGIFLKMEGILLNEHVNIIFEPNDVIDKKLLILTWTSMTDHYIGKAPSEIRYIEDLLKDACVCKGTVSNEKELIGYYLTNMIIDLKDVHSSHFNTPSLSPGDTVIGRDELYD